MVAALCGLCNSAVIVHWVKRSLVRVSPGKAMPRHHTYPLLLIGTVSGIGALGRSVADAMIFIGVTSLLVSQVTIDITAHRLMRLPTVFCTVVVCLGLWYRELTSGSLFTAAHTTASSLVVPTIFGLCALKRPQNLGLGDVLIAIPLSMAVASVGVWLLPWWVLGASASGSIHGAFVKLRGRRTVPFGPHLLLWAWLVLLIGV